MDVAVGNARPGDGLWLLPHVILVECKHWDKPVDSSTVGYFMNIMAGRGIELGLLVAANGTTGDRDDLTNAHALGPHGSPRAIKIVVITTEGIAGLQPLPTSWSCCTAGTSVHSLPELLGFRRRLVKSPLSRCYALPMEVGAAPTETVQPSSF
jgi:Restriction endonuclease